MSDDRTTQAPNKSENAQLAHRAFEGALISLALSIGLGMATLCTSGLGHVSTWLDGWPALVLHLSLWSAALYCALRSIWLCARCSRLDQHNFGVYLIAFPAMGCVAMLLFWMLLLFATVARNGWGPTT
jgi:hypothetical protein